VCLAVGQTPLRQPSSWSGQIQQHHIGALLNSFEDNFSTVCGDVEVANVELGAKIRQLSLDASLHIDKPKVLVFHLSSQQHQ
jgi:hypothetical protein